LPSESTGRRPDPVRRAAACRGAPRTMAVGARVSPPPVLPLTKQYYMFKSYPLNYFSSVLIAIPTYNIRDSIDVYYGTYFQNLI